MILGSNKKIENSIIKTLATHGSSSVEQIEEYIKKDKNPSTIQGIYRSLRKLQKEGVIIKEKNKHSLRIPWLLELSTLVSYMEETYLNESYLNQLIPEQRKKTWTFTNLIKANDLRTQILLALAKTAKNKISLSFSPHAWSEIINMGQSAQFKKTLLNFIDYRYNVIGGQSFVDKYVNALTKNPKKEKTYLAPKQDYIENDRSLYVDIIDNYVLYTKLDNDTAKNIDTLYWSIANEDDMHLLEIFETFNGRIKIKMSIKKDPRLAGSYRKKFETLFGPLGKEW